jgi:hypothetical protein
MWRLRPARIGGLTKIDGECLEELTWKCGRDVEKRGLTIRPHDWVKTVRKFRLERSEYPFTILQVCAP